MKNITEELKEQDAVMCMRCGSIYTGKGAYYEDCPKCRDKGIINWVTGNMHRSFWGSSAAKHIAEEFSLGCSLAELLGGHNDS